MEPNNPNSGKATPQNQWHAFAIYARIPDNSSPLWFMQNLERLAGAASVGVANSDFYVFYDGNLFHLGDLGEPNVPTWKEIVARQRDKMSHFANSPNVVSENCEPCETRDKTTQEVPNAQEG